MRLTFQVSVEVDKHWIERIAAQRSVTQGYHPSHTPGRLLGQMAGEIENALSDAVIYKDGIVAGSVRVVRSEN